MICTWGKYGVRSITLDTPRVVKQPLIVTIITLHLYIFVTEENSRKRVEVEVQKNLTLQVSISAG